MKLNKPISTTILFLLNILLCTSNLTAQEDQRLAQTLDLKTLNGAYRNGEVNQLISEIITDEDFKYRSALKKAKTNQKYYLIGRVKISETDLLKHFKKAARKSDSVAAFAGYFQNRNLDFITVLDQYVLEQLYNTLRQTTFNGFLDNWQKYY